MRRRFLALCLGLPLFAVLVGDGLLAFRFEADLWFRGLAWHLLGNMLATSLATAGLFALLWAVSHAVRGGRDGGLVRARTAVVGLVGITALNYLVSSLFATTHWTLPVARHATMAVATLLYAIYVPWPRLTSASSRWVWPCVVALGGLMLVTIFLFGTSYTSFSGKHLREPIAAMLIHQLELMFVLAVVGTGDDKLQSALRPMFAGLVAFLLGTAAMSGVSRASHYTVAVRLEGTRAMRLLTRSIGMIPLVGRLPWLATLTGTRRTFVQPVADESVNPPCEATRDRTVQSVLLVSIDALRADYFGLDSSTLPGISMLRDSSVEFVDAYQPTPSTAGTFLSFRTGRYPIIESPSFNMLPSIAKARGMNYVYTDQFDRSFHGRKVVKIPTEQFTDGIIAQLHRFRSESKAFLYHAHYLTIHLPTGSSEGWNYQAMVREVDAALARVLKSLTEEKLTDDTLVIVTADHGEELVSERGYASHGRGAAQTLLRTPLFVMWPGHPPGQRAERVSGNDILPTMLDALGVSCEYKTHGASLRSKTSAKRIFYSSSSYAEHGFGYTDTHAVIDGRWKLIFSRGENAFALHDIEADPKEERNLVDDQPEVVERLTAELDAYLRGDIATTPARPLPGGS